VLAYSFFNFGMSILDRADLTAEYRKSSDGYTQMLQGMRDGWVMSQDNEPQFRVPAKYRTHLYVSPFKVVIEGPKSNQDSAESGQNVSTKSS